MTVKPYRGAAPLAVSAEMIIGVVKEAVRNGTDEELLAFCRERNLSVILAADAVNELKTFLDKQASRAASAEVQVFARRAADSDQCEAG
jgi:hypothetical protein